MANEPVGIGLPAAHAPGHWTQLCLLDELPRKGGKFIMCGNRPLAIFRDPTSNGRPIVRVIDDTCPHAGGSLSAGHICDGCVVCPWHAWPFSVATGQCPDNPQIRVRAYEARITNDHIEAKLPA